MQIRLQLLLPRESQFVPLLRSTAAKFLRDLGVPKLDIDDVSLILTEACANVVRHAVDTQRYTVDVSVSRLGCTIEVRDDGPGFVADDVPRAPAGGRDLPAGGLDLPAGGLDLPEGGGICRRVSWILRKAGEGWR